ncbi:MAG: hypothetical protein LBD43_00285, partial [Holosporales bacterium]|nr:hypothetical protein [Holosporales bacterium]
AEEQVTVKIGDYEEAAADGAFNQAERNKGKNSQSENKEVHIDCVGITVGQVPTRLRGEYPEQVKIVVTGCDESPNTFHDPALLPGDGILSINGVVITLAQQAKSTLETIWKNQHNIGRAIPIVIWRHGSMVMVAITVEPEPEADRDDKKAESKRK